MDAPMTRYSVPKKLLAGAVAKYRVGADVKLRQHYSEKIPMKLRINISNNKLFSFILNRN